MLITKYLIRIDTSHNHSSKVIMVSSSNKWYNNGRSWVACCFIFNNNHLQDILLTNKTL